MSVGEAAGSVDWSPVLGGLQPFLPWVALLAALLVVLMAPLPNRGPGLFARRDPWRTFKYNARRTVLARAGHRCEGALLVPGCDAGTPPRKSITSTPGPEAVPPW